jgi:F-type H+-transporting ATPase subunit a
MTKKIIFLFIATCLLSMTAFADHKEEKTFNASETILHHILDSHDWHLTDLPGGTPVALHLPWMFYSSRDGFQFYANTAAMEEAGKYGVDGHGTLYAIAAGGAHTNPTPHQDNHAADTTHHADTPAVAHADEGHHAPANSDASVSITDISITKTALQMLLIAILMIIVFTNVAKAYTTNRGKAPKGLQSMMEVIIVFVRDLAKEYLGNKHEKFLPYLLTLFFFIWFSNLLGLTPLNSNIAGNISVTASLAVLSMILINVNASKDYWKHIFAAPGVPKPMLLILTPVEILGVFTKPFALAIRLFANISAGHFMTLALICLVFILGKVGESLGGAIGGAVLGVSFALIIFCLEMLVAIIQAYIFTLLTTVFLSMAMESHDDHHHHEEHHAPDSEVNKDLRLSDFGVS